MPSRNPCPVGSAFTGLFNEAVTETALHTLWSHLCRVLGNDHPSTLIIRTRLALEQSWVHLFAARRIFALLVDELVQALGKDHTVISFARHGMAYWMGEAGDPAGAAACLTDVVGDLVRVLGEDHHVTDFMRSQLARWQGPVEVAELPEIPAIEADRHTGTQALTAAQAELPGGTVSEEVPNAGRPDASPFMTAPRGVAKAEVPKARQVGYLRNKGPDEQPLCRILAETLDVVEHDLVVFGCAGSPVQDLVSGQILQDQGLDNDHARHWCESRQGKRGAGSISGAAALAGSPATRCVATPSARLRTAAACWTRTALRGVRGPEPDR